MTVHLETPRLVLRSFDEGDGDAWITLVNDKDVGRYLPPGDDVSIDVFPGVVERRRALERDRGFAMWAVERRDTGEFLGQCGFYLSEGKGPEVELAYHYLPTTWGQGYGTEAAEAALEYAFGTLGLDAVIAFVMRDNIGSSRVAEKVEMRLLTDDATAYDLPHLRKYELTRSDWQARRAAPATG